MAENTNSTGYNGFTNTTGADPSRYNYADPERFSTYLYKHFRPFAFALIFLITVVALTVAMFWLRGYCFTRCGLNCCPGSATESQRRQIRMDQSLAEQVQREIAQQEREAATKEKASKRLAYYRQFLNAHTRIVQPQDLLVQKHDHHSPKAEAAATTEAISVNDDDTASCELARKRDRCSPKIPNDTTMSDQECSKSFDCDDLIIQFTVPQVNKSSTEVDDDVDEEAAAGTEIRTEATCSICLKNYQPGESIVWSSACRHVYHADCMLQWVATTGKKRCPVCRKLFVSSASLRADAKRRRPAPTGSG